MEFDLRKSRAIECWEGWMLVIADWVGLKDYIIHVAWGFRSVTGGNLDVMGNRGIREAEYAKT